MSLYPIQADRSAQYVGDNLTTKTSATHDSRADDIGTASTTAQLTAEQFEKQLNEQQKITAQPESRKAFVFDTLSDIEQNSTYQQPEQTSPL